MRVVGKKKVLRGVSRSHLHISQRGIPSFVHSDGGSQLVAASRNLSEDLPRYDWDAISASTGKQGTTWKFAPAGAQWRNGATEAFVKKFKLSFCHMYQNNEFNYAELDSPVKRIANVLNNRPVSAQRTKSYSPDEDFLSPLTPNMLVTGRNGLGPPQEYLHEYDSDPRIRRSYLEDMECAWWYQYKVQCFDSLLPTRKWNTVKRNISVGDVVLIKYSSKTAPGTYRLGRITNTELEEDGVVRTCTAKYALCSGDLNSKAVHKEICVPVQRLVLILPVEEQNS